MSCRGDARDKQFGFEHVRDAALKYVETKWGRLEDASWILGERTSESAGATWNWQARFEEAAADGSITWYFSRMEWCRR